MEMPPVRAYVNRMRAEGSTRRHPTAVLGAAIGHPRFQPAVLPYTGMHKLRQATEKKERFCSKNACQPLGKC